MKGRAFLIVADELAAGTSEAHWRSAIGRAYYSLMLEGWEALLRWGFRVPPHENIHSFVRHRFTFPADNELKEIGDALDATGRLRNQADYGLGIHVAFLSQGPAIKAIEKVRQGLGVLDAIEADPGRRTTAIAAIRAAFP